MHYTTSCNTQSSAPEDERNNRPKHVELIGIINKPLMLLLVGFYIIYRDGFPSRLAFYSVEFPLEETGHSLKLVTHIHQVPHQS